MVNYRNERQIKFINLDKSLEEYYLEIDEQLLDIKCPLDQTNLISYYNIMDKGVKCPNCGIHYGRRNLSPENLQRKLNLEIFSVKRDLKYIEEKRKYLKQFLNFVDAQNKFSKQKS